MCSGDAKGTGAPTRSRPGMTWLRPGTADRADHAPHDAEDAEIGVLSDHDRRVLLVCGDELHAVTQRPVILDRGLVVQARHDDLAGAGAVLLLYDDVVALQDAGVDHAVAANVQREQLVGLAEHLARLERTGPVLIGEDGLAGR